MIRTQIQITEQQARDLKRQSREQGVSISELVRQALQQSLDRRDASLRTRYQKAAELVGAFRDLQGATDVAVDHDRYLDEAYR
ncbi:MAG TPA: CopG family transcriptional regulator [Thermoanaerobaculia bacterium]|nr:CopG family transcriptional regulator [Thermoanaerobaculia bacterium]